MENNTKIQNSGAEQKSERKRNKPNCLSTLFLWWMCPVLYNGNRRDVEESDLIVPNKSYDSELIGEEFERYWLDEVNRASAQNREPSLWSAMVRGYWLSYMPGAIYILIQSACRIYQPLLFAQLLSHWTVDSPITRQEAGFYAFAMLGLNFVTMMCQHHNNLFVSRFSLRMKVACSALIYRKLLRSSQVALSEVASGKLVNLLSNDIVRFDYAFMFLHYLWIVPIQAAVVLYLLYQVAGYAPFVGLFGVSIIIFPIQSGLTKLTVSLRRKTAMRTDFRIKLMSEIINGIQVIKMYAWEKPFEYIVKNAREHEMKALRLALYVRSNFIGFMLYTERSIMFLTSLVIVLTGNLNTATVIYPVQQLLSTLQINLTMILPLAISSLSEMKVSLERIQGFLMTEERRDLAVTNNSVIKDNITFNSKSVTEKSDIVSKRYSQKNSFISSVSNDSDVPPRKSIGGENAVEIFNVSASWTNDASEMSLKNLSLRIRKGKLCAIIGAVGSGKSSLLQLLLKELPASHGNVCVNGRLSYASQESWLFSATVRDNILFGWPYDSKKYKEVCRVCSLLPDFKQFPFGDMSLVGERGVSLSGGQKARINLARCIYRDADIYLLDDPLSAVDANVGRSLFEVCIKGYLRGRTVILVTHQIHFLKSADTIVILNEGAIENVGSYDELVNSGKEFSSILSSLKENIEESGDKIPRKNSFKRGVSVISNKSDDVDYEFEKQVVSAEERAKGGLKWSVLLQYFKSVKSCFVIAMTILALSITQAAGTGIDYWLSYWTNQVNIYEQSLGEGEEPDPGLGTLIGSLTNAEYLYVYGGLLLALIVFAQIRIINFVYMTMRASQNLHNTVFGKLIIAVMRFFDTNPSGRVLNRISKDIGAVDELLPRNILETIQMYLAMTSVLVLNAIALYWTLIPTIVLLLIFVPLLKWYLNAAQAVKRLEGTTKSPVLSMINSTISGLSTIRSSNSQGQLLKSFDDAQDLHTSAFYTYVGGSSAFGLYLDAICLVYLGTVLIIFLFVDFGDTIPVGSLGLAVSQTMVLTMLLQMAARLTAEFLAQMTSFERVLEYTHLPMENNMYDGPKQPPKQWPSKGTIKFENVSMKYGPDDPYVLKNLNIEISSGWKVGVVGRTGAGKSSLINALFRLTDIEGSIKIDDIDTSDIAKSDMRSKISIIPQEPVLFSATLRYNLDPFSQFSDDDLWRSLEQVELKEAVSALDFKVAEGGTNFSVGQRQLVCLARAVLRSNKVLVMDEATANVDPQTDALIQKTIRREFATCTVITIAHRLNTIMDSDRVLVMDKGEAVEFDYPFVLLSNPNSIFSSMVRELGENMQKTLLNVARTKYVEENPQ